MTHYTVLVAVDDPEKLDEVLAPFDENISVPAYRDYLRGAPQEHWSVRPLREEGLLPDGELTWEQVASAHNARCGDDDDYEKIFTEDGAAWTMSTYNPQSKWDWYAVGGRWKGYFPYDSAMEHLVINPDGQRADGGQKKALLLDSLRFEREADARMQYRGFSELVSGLPEALPWKAFTARLSQDYKIEQARDDYHGQERVRALKGTEFDYPLDDAIERYGCTEAEYAGKARDSAVPGYALLTHDGRWVEPGKMGWFAVSDDDEDSRAEYNRIANEYIDSLDEEMYLIIVDVHI